MRAEAQVRPGEADARPAQRQARPGQLIRRHWLAIVLLAVGLVLRVLTLLAYRPALFFTDTVRYLYNAEGMDPVGYKGPLRVILLAGNFNAAAAVQHLLGLAMAVVIYLLLLRRGAPRWLAALAMGPVLLDAYQLQSEQTILPGTWFQALILAGLAVLLWRPEPPAWRRAAAAGAVLGTSALFAQIGEALLVPALIFVIVAGLAWRRALTGAAALAAAFAVPILAYCTGSYLMTGDFFLSHTGATSFYGRTAAAAGCATLRLPVAERGLCPSPAKQARGPDWLEYGAGSPVRPYYADLPRGRTDSLITDFSRRVVAQQPARVLGAYGRDLLKLYEPVRTGSPDDTPISRWQFQLAYPYYQHATPAVVATASSRYGGGAPAVWRPVAGFLRGYQLGGGYTPGPLLALFTLAGLAGSAALALRREDERTRQLAEACLLFFLSAASVLLVSDLFEFSWRYQLPALVTLVPAGALGLSVLLRLPGSRAGGRGDPAR